MDSRQSISTKLRAARRDAEQTTILVVEDRREAIIGLEAALEPLHQRVLTAETGREALRAALEEEVAVILLDVEHPEMDGFETAARLREAHRTKHTPIIFLTASDRELEQAARGYALGAADCIAKPVENEMLRSKVSVLVGLHQRASRTERLNRSLEARVRDCTRSLDVANEELERQVARRHRAEAEVRELGEKIEARVRARTLELESANDELLSFSYSVSHDLRAPLRKIESLSELLLNECGDELGEKASSYLVRILSSSREMNRLISALLKLSRISREQMDFKQVDLSTLARDTVADLRSAEPDRRVDVRIEDGIVAHGDPSLLRIVLDNLLGNAWKFTSTKDDALIEVLHAQSGGARGFCVRDSGVGFPMGHAKKLFQPFQRLHPSSAFPGTGIGLAIVHRIVRRHGGDIRAEGEEGAGASFTMVLPVR